MTRRPAFCCRPGPHGKRFLRGSGGTLLHYYTTPIVPDPVFRPAVVTTGIRINCPESIGTAARLRNAAALPKRKFRYSRFGWRVAESSQTFYESRHCVEPTTVVPSVPVTFRSLVTRGAGLGHCYLEYASSYRESALPMTILASGAGNKTSRPVVGGGRLRRNRSWCQRRWQNMPAERRNVVPPG